MKGKKASSKRKKYLTKKRKKAIRNRRIFISVFIICITLLFIFILFHRKDKNYLDEEKLYNNVFTEYTNYTSNNNTLQDDSSFGNINGTMYILNTQSKYDDTIYGYNQAILIKSKDNKYTLIDSAGDFNKNLCDNLLNNIRNIAGNNIKLDQLIITNSHSEHFGCINYLLNNGYISSKNIYIKKVSQDFQKNDYYEELVSNYKVNYINSYKDGEYLNLSDIKIYFYNNQDVYKDTKCNKKINILKFEKVTSNAGLATSNGKYIYLDNPNDTSIHLSNTFELNSNKYYAVSEIRNNCNENANSVALLVEIPTNNKSKYIYIPSDIENNGYSYFGSYNSTLKGYIYGNGSTFAYKVDDNGYIVKDGELVPDSGNLVKKASEYIVSSKIKNKLGDNINDIVAYVVSNHGFNASLESINLLNLNRNNLYSITTTSMSIGKTNNSSLLRTYNYTLSNSKIYHSGGNNVYLNIYNNGKVTIQGNRDK